MEQHSVTLLCTVTCSALQLEGRLHAQSLHLDASRHIVMVVMLLPKGSEEPGTSFQMDVR